MFFVFLIVIVIKVVVGSVGFGFGCLVVVNKFFFFIGGVGLIGYFLVKCGIEDFDYFIGDEVIVVFFGFGYGLYYLI